MADTIKDFLVSLGFKGDEASAKKVVDLAKKVETDITKATTDGADDRVGAEKQASTERIGIIAALGKIFVSMEMDRADKAGKIRKDEAGKEEKLSAEKARKDKERRAAALKELQVNATRMASFALKTVAAVEATALGIVYATDKAAKSFERLNYAAQRTGAAPGKITAFGYAAEQTGGSAEGAQASLENFGQKLRVNPDAYARQLKTMGIEARDANGHMRDSADILADLGQHLATISKSGPSGYGNALGYAQMFGEDEQTMLASMKPQFRGRMAERQAIDAKTGANQGDAAQAGTAFEQSMRKLDGVLESIRTKVETTLFKKLQPDLDKLSDWGEKHGGQVADIIARIADDVVKLATAVFDHLSKVDWDTVLTKVENFGKDLDKTLSSLFGENGTAVIAMAAFGLIVADKLLRPLNLVLSTLGAIGGHSLVGRLLGGTSRAALGAATSAAGVTVAAVALGATAESTPDAATQAKQAQYYKDHPDAHATVFGAIGGWLKDKFGMGSSDPDARKVKDAIIATADATKKIADGNGAGGGGLTGVTASSGGLGGSGQHVGGGTSPGASFADRGRGGHGFSGGSGPSDPNLPAGNAPGASGYGTINAYWKGALDKRGEGGHTGPKEMFDYLKAQGASDNEAVLLTGAASSESSFNPNAVHDNGTGHGLFGHKDTRLDMRAKDWQEQSRLALAEARRMFGDRITKAHSPEELADLEMHYERPRGYKANNPRAGDNYTGRLNSIRRFSALTGQPTASAPSPAGTSAKAITDAEVFAARQRILNGSTSASDHALVDRYKQQQNAPKPDVTHLRNMQAVIRARHGNVLPFLHPDAHLSAAARTAINNQRNNHYAMTHSPTFNINGGDPHAMLADAHRLAGRGQADMVRNLSVMEA